MAISTPSITIRPPALSRIRNKAKAKDDLPAPVRPTIPICRKEHNSKIQQINKLIIKPDFFYTVVCKSLLVEHSVKKCSTATRQLHK